MKVKIDEKIVCIPPYVSTTWEQIVFLQSEEDPHTHLFTLVIHLADKKEVHIPNLDPSLIDVIFAAHTRHLEKSTSTLAAGQKKGGEDIKTLSAIFHQLTGISPEQLAGMPIRLGITGIEGFPVMEVLQHNQTQSDDPDLAPDVLEKISGMIKMISQGDITSFPKAEPHCNCPHCQVARSIHSEEKNEKLTDTEPSIDEEDLKFRDWEIMKQGDNLYTVTNPIDASEYYSVYLGNPVGCNCGQPHCEHIKAVLYS